jgi:hypothetical protein
MCGLHRAQGDEERGFHGLASKPKSTVSSDLASKPVAMISWFGSQNQVGCGLSVVPQNRREDEDGVGHASRYSSLFHLEARRARVPQSSLKTGRGTAWKVYVTPLWRSRGDEAKDGWVDATGSIRLFYPNLAIFIVLGHKSSLVISFPIIMTPRAGGEVSNHLSLSHHLAIVAF